MSTNKVTPPRGSELTLTTALKAVPANIPVKSTVIIDGVSFTQPQLVTNITTLLAPFSAARAAQLALTQAVQTRNQNDPAVQAFVANFKAAITALFGRSSPILAQFGFTPHKASSATSGKNVVRAARSLATRKLLGTKGPQQKAQLLAQQPPAFSVDSQGTVVLVTPSDASPTAPASAANTSSASTSNSGASGISTPANTAAGSTTPSGS